MSMLAPWRQPNMASVLSLTTAEKSISISATMSGKTSLAAMQRNKPLISSRYLNITLTREHSITTGKIYQHVIERERRGDYLGKTVQVVPHITNGIQDWIERAARLPVDDTREEPDVCIIELGGTVGDIESAPFIEAMRQLRRRAGRDNFCQIHVSLVPVIGGEQKTKPTQQAIREVRSAGLSPDLVFDIMTTVCG